MYIIIGCLIGIILGYGICHIVNSNKLHKLELENSRLSQYKEISENLAESFKDIAANSIKEEQADLRKQNQEALDEKLKPLSENLNRFMTQIQSLDKNGQVNLEVFKDNIKKLEESQGKITEETKKLTEALTLNQNIKGQYGEDLLSCILERSGLQENVNYTKQFSTVSENSSGEMKTIRPDFVINLPENKSLIIDSKFTLDTFIEYQDKKTKEAKIAFRSELKERIKDLANKNYQHAEGLIQPEFILCYIPLETTINLIYTDNDFEDLVKDAYLKNILIVGTSSVLTAINLVKELWATQNTNEHYKDIAIIGKNLYEAFAIHFEELESIEKKFNELGNVFKTTINRYRTKGAKQFSILKQVEELKLLVPNTTKEIPESFQLTNND